MARIAPASPPYDDDTERLLTEMMPPGVPPIRLFRTFARHPTMARAMQSMGAYTFSKDLTLTSRQRELIILRTCARNGCEYEWGVHMAFFADRVGLDAPQAHAIVQGDAGASCWTEPIERLLIKVVDELHDTSMISDDTWHDARAQFTEQQLLDLSVLVGWYSAISYIANVATVEREDGAPRFDDYASSGPPEP